MVGAAAAPAGVPGAVDREVVVGVEAENRWLAVEAQWEELARLRVELEHRRLLREWGPVPADAHDAVSVLQETEEFNALWRTHANARLIDASGHILNASHLGFTTADRVGMARLLALPESVIGASRIEGYFLRFLQELPCIHTLAGVRRTRLNQYDSIVRPVQAWLKRQGVGIERGTRVTDVEFDLGEGGRRRAERILFERDGATGAYELGSHDYAFIHGPARPHTDYRPGQGVLRMTHPLLTPPSIPGPRSPSQRVMVGFDGSRESLAAVAWAAGEARRRGLALRLLHAWGLEPDVHSPLVGPGTRSRVSEEVPRTTAERVRRTHPGLEVLVRQRCGEPAAVLCEAAEKSEPLVLGSRGLGGVAGFVVGSVALAVVARTWRPVVLVRDCEPIPGGDVVLGLDLSHPCDEVLEFAFSQAHRLGLPLRVVHGPRHPGPRRRRPRARRTRPPRRPRQGARPGAALLPGPARHRGDPPRTPRPAAAGRPSCGRPRRHRPPQPGLPPRAAHRRPHRTLLHRSRTPVAVVPHD
ncbi:oleate hydratase [Streptomyces sp. NPDC029721]|uniref:oleate hydratase n=1 Tax=Streptomyces sp. NPDC029721 TaxID=3157090 RepID=UPI0033EC7C8A